MAEEFQNNKANWPEAWKNLTLDQLQYKLMTFIVKDLGPQIAQSDDETAKTINKIICKLH